MGMSINFYAGNAQDFEDWRRLSAEEEDLMLKYSKRHKRVLNAYEKKVEAWENSKHPTDKNMPRLAEYEWMSKKEFAKWYDASAKAHVALEFGQWVELPQLYHSKDYWLVQWVLNLNKRKLVNPTDGNIGIDDPWFMLSKTGVNRLIECLTKALKSRRAFLAQFPIYPNLAYGSNRKEKYCVEWEEMTRTNGNLQYFIDSLKYVQKNILTSFNYPDLIMEILP